jgi:hypothetical protein
MSEHRRSRAAVAAAVVVLCAALPVLVAFHHPPRQALPARTAIADALRSPTVREALRDTHWLSAQGSAVDGRIERVSFFAGGGRAVAEVAVGADGTVAQVQPLAHQAVPYGDWIAYEPGVIAALSALFVLMAGVAPLRRLRNLDVLAAVSLVAPVVLFQHGYLDDSTLAALPGLGYLLVRCAWLGLGPRRDLSASTPLLERITPNWEARQRIRAMRVVLVALALVFLMVGVSSPDPVDVAYATMEGATQIAHGLLPYGHMPGDILHGDTYPILAYALYAPLAVVAPVDSVFSSVDGALAVAALAALAAAAVVLVSAVGPRRRSGSRSPVAEQAGLRAAITWLSFPPLLIIASTGTTDVVLAAMLAFAVVLWHRPAASMGVLAVAGWFKLAPFALVPIWLAPLRGRRLAAAVGAGAGVSAATVALLVALGGVHGPAAMVHAVAYQFERASLQSPWTSLGVASWQPVGQACVLALIAAAATRLRHDAELATDRARIAALSAAILIALQLVANYWAFLYLAWIVPLIGMSLLADRIPESVLAPPDGAPLPAASVSPFSCHGAHGHATFAR